MYSHHRAMLMENGLGKANLRAFASVYPLVTFRLRLPIPPSSCSCAGAADAGICSGVGLIKGAASGLDKWDGPAVQGVTLSAPLPFRSFALPAISAPVRPL